MIGNPRRDRIEDYSRCRKESLNQCTITWGKARENQRGQVRLFSAVSVWRGECIFRLFGRLAGFRRKRETKKEMGGGVWVGI